MPRPYTRLLLVAVLLAVLASTTLLGSPVLPAVVGAAGVAAILYLLEWRRARSTAGDTANRSNRI